MAHPPEPLASTDKILATGLGVRSNLLGTKSRLRYRNFVLLFYRQTIQIGHYVVSWDLCLTSEMTGRQKS